MPLSNALAFSCRSLPSHSVPFLSPPFRTVRTYPGRAIPRIYHPSQTNSRQLGGIIPSLRALEIMPRCLLSARSTWHRLHRVLRFFNSLVAFLPLLMWSMSHSSRVCGVSHRTHVLPSRSQTMRRSSSQTSRGGRCLGTLFVVVDVKRFNNEPAKSDTPAIPETDKATGINKRRLHLATTDDSRVPENAE